MSTVSTTDNNYITRQLIQNAKFEELPKLKHWPIKGYKATLNANLITKGSSAHLVSWSLTLFSSPVKLSELYAVKHTTGEDCLLIWLVVYQVSAVRASK